MSLLNSEDFESQVRELEKIIELLEKFNNEKKMLTFLTVEDLITATGFSRKRVLDLFNDPEFPCCNYGKKQIAEINAVIEYFSKPRRGEYSTYWRNLKK